MSSPARHRRRRAHFVLLSLVATAGLGVVAFAAAAPPPSPSTQRTLPRGIPTPRPATSVAPTSRPTSTAAPTTSAAPTTAPVPTTAPAPTGSSATPPTGPADLRCTIAAFGSGDTPVPNGGTAKPILEPNGMHSFRYVVTFTNAGGATGTGFKVRYDYVQKIGGSTTTSTNGPVAFGAFPAGGSGSTGKLMMAASGPFPNSHEVTVTLDVDGEVAEVNEANNTCKISVNLE